MRTATQPGRASRWGRLLAVVALLALALGAAPRPVAAAPAIDLDFDGADNPAVLNSFLTTVLPGTNLLNSNLSVNQAAPGALRIVTTEGDLLPGATRMQDNALAVAYESAGKYTIAARLRGPLPFMSSFQSGGIYLGTGINSYIRFSAGVGSRRSTGWRLQLDVMDRGRLRASTVELPELADVRQSLDLFLTVDHTSNKITALYRADSPSSAFTDARQAIVRPFPRWLRVSGNNTVPVHAGVLGTSRAASPFNLDIDWFRVLTTPVQATVGGFKDVNRDGVSPGETVRPGDDLLYTITLANNSTAASLQVVDPIPADTTFVEGSLDNPDIGNSTFDPTTNQVIWEGALNRGEAVAIRFRVRVNELPLQSSEIVNEATLTNLSANNQRTLLSTVTTVSGTPDLSTSTYTAAPATVGPNGVVTYTLQLQNGGTMAASGVTTRLTIPEGATYVPGSARASSGMTPTLDTSIDTIAWDAGEPLAVGQVVTITFQARAAAALQNGTPLVSQATLQAHDTLPNFLTAQATFQTPSTVAGSKTVDKAVAAPGEILAYTIRVVNNGGVAANLQLVDPIPADTTYVAGSASATTGAAPQVANGRLTWQASLAASQTATITLRVTINAPPLSASTVTNRATLTNLSAGGQQTLLSASTSVRGVADLSNSTYTVAPAVVGQGGIVTYTLVLRNTGTTSAVGARAQLSIPSGGTYIIGSAHASTGDTPSLDPAINQITWNASAPLAIGGSVTISFKARVGSALPNGARLTSQATFQASATLPITRSAQTIVNRAAPAPQDPLFLPIVSRR